MSVNIQVKRSATLNKRPDPSTLQFGELAVNYNASSTGVFYAADNGTLVKIGPAAVSATAPNASPAGFAGNSIGEFWFNSGTTALSVWDGTAWISIGSTSNVTSVTGTSPIIVNNTTPTTPIIGINTASTTQAGATTLNDTVTSTSAVLAATANAVKTAYDAAVAAQVTATAALPKAGGTMTGDIVFNSTQTFPVSGIQDATTVQKGIVQIGANVTVSAGTISIADSTTSVKGVVQVGTNIDVTSGTISVADGTTTTKGIVQLNNTTSSTSTTLALTAAQGKSLQDQIDALIIANNITLAGTFNATTGLVDSVTSAGTTAGFVVGSALPTAAAANKDYFVIIDVAGSTGPAGTPPYHIGDWFLSDGSAWQFLNVGFQAAYATTTTEGVITLSTDAATQAGTNSLLAVTPSTLQSKVSDSISTTSTTTIASSTAVKSAYDLANAALPKSGGTMTGAITAAAAGIIFSDASTVVAITDSISTTSSSTAASATAVKSSYDLANAALPKAGGTMTGVITFDAAQTFPIAGIAIATTSSLGVVSVGSNISVTVGGAISVATGTTAAVGVVQLVDSTTSTSTTLAATPNSVKTAYDLAAAAVPKSVAVAKGNILVGTASATVSVLTVGTDGQFLLADSSQTTGLAYTSSVDGGTF
jgi:Phage tail fibre repeat